jgi:hypothetical protein
MQAIDDAECISFVQRVGMDDDCMTRIRLGERRDIVWATKQGHVVALLPQEFTEAIETQVFVIQE